MISFCRVNRSELANKAMSSYRGPLKTLPDRSRRIKMHEERKTKKREADVVPEGAVPAYLLDREGQSRAKILSNMIKQKRKEKAVSRGLHASRSSSRRGKNPVVFMMRVATNVDQNAICCGLFATGDRRGLRFANFTASVGYSKPPLCTHWPQPRGVVALRSRMAHRGTILNYAIFVGRCHGQSKKKFAEKRRSGSNAICCGLFAIGDRRGLRFANRVDSVGPLR